MVKNIKLLLIIVFLLTSVLPCWGGINFSGYGQTEPYYTFSFNEYKQMAHLLGEIVYILENKDSYGKDYRLEQAKAIHSYQEAMEIIKNVAYRERLKALNNKLDEYWAEIFFQREEARRKLDEYLAAFAVVSNEASKNKNVGALIITKVYTVKR